MSISTSRSERLSELAEKWERVEDLWGGTDTMVAAGKQYLPQEPREDDANYRIRLQRSKLFNKYRKTVESSVGKVFTKSILVQEMPLVMEDHLDNIDAEGSAFDVFGKRMLTDAIHFGIGYIVVDFPIQEEDAPTVTDTAPYWVRINPLSIVDVQVDFINGKETLTRFAFKEVVADYAHGYDGLSGEVVTREQTKVFYLDGEYTPQYAVINNENEVISQGAILNGAGDAFSKLPVVPVYGDKIEPYIGQPVLIDLADLNIAHWQDWSDLRNINHVSSLPQMVIKGAQEQYDENGNPRLITISPNSVINIQDPQGDAKWIEHSGSSISTNHDMLKHLEEKMSVMGIELFSGAGETATGRVIDANEQNSKLKCIALDLESALIQALRIHAEYIGIMDSDISVVINTDYTTMFNSEDLKQVIELYNLGIVEASTVLDEAKKRSVVTDPTLNVPTGQTNDVNDNKDE